MITDCYNCKAVYGQICEHFRKLILYGGMAPGDKMPSVRSLAAELSINPNTIQKAFAELERQGYIVSRQGKGSFVAENAVLIEHRMEEISDAFRLLSEEALRMGIDSDRIRAVMEKALDDAGKGTKQN